MSKVAEKVPPILLIDPSASRARLFSSAIDRSNLLTSLPNCRTLEEAYNLTESNAPSLVVLSEALVNDPGFAMYKALLDGLKTDWLVLSQGPSPTFPEKHAHRLIEPSKLANADDIVEFLANRLRKPGRTPSSAWHNNGSVPARELVVIGASTGGVEALTEILRGYARDCPPTLIVQHMGHRFIEGFAARLNTHCAADVVQASDGMPIRSGQVIVAPGHPKHLTIATDGSTCRLTSDDAISGHRPSVDALFRSAARLGPRVVGVLLTGMGRDGADGLLRIRKAGGLTIAQDEATSVVFGMPKSASLLGAVEDQLPINKIGPAILRACAKMEQGRIA